MPAGPVVLNNTPLVALSILGRLDLLRDLFGEVLIPEAVQEEFLAVDTALRREALAGAPWIRPVALAHPRRALSYSGLDLGEAEVLALAEERSAGLLVIDEKKARRYAERMKFSLTGTLGLLLLGREQGLIGSVTREIETLQEAGLYLDPSLVARARQLAGE
jgi:predicted nucleic acid-binding protein